MFRTYEEEKHSELVDSTLTALASLMHQVTKARTEHDLAAQVYPTACVMLGSDSYNTSFKVARIEEIRRQIDVVHEMLEQFEVDLRSLNERVIQAAAERSKEEFDARNSNVRKVHELHMASFFDSYGVKK